MERLGPKWNVQELENFYDAFHKNGKDWKKVAAAVGNRTVEMVESLYTINRAYLSLPEGGASVTGLIALMTDRYSNLEIIDQGYFEYYEKLESHQRMLADSIRTEAYFKAIQGFDHRVVLDVGAGSGILSLFAARAGASKVYAVEASEIAKYASKMIEKNQPFGSRIEVIHDKIEDVILPEKVDILISEPLGFLLVHERMIETYVKARERFLKPGGQMFPDKGIIYVAPYNDEDKHSEILLKAKFWASTDFMHIVDLSPLHEDALDYYFSQPQVTACEESVLLAPPCSHVIDFESVKVHDLQNLEIPFKFIFQEIPTDETKNPRDIDGMIFWFDVNLQGSEKVLTTKPGPNTTHWKQVVCLFRHPIKVREEMEISGMIQMEANEERSYTIKLSLTESTAEVQKPPSHFIYQLQDHFDDTCDEDGEDDGDDGDGEDEV